MLSENFNYSSDEDEFEDVLIENLFPITITRNLMERAKNKNKDAIKINNLRSNFKNISKNITELRKIKKFLEDHPKSFGNVWQEKLDEANKLRSKIDSVMKTFDDQFLKKARNALAARSAKRLRQRRVRMTNKQEKKELQRKWEERSRVIDENMQKIKDSLNKAKQEEDMRIKADLILRDVIRMKHDAKKNLSKLDALEKLRKARLDTAKGRGKVPSQNDASIFTDTIGKLKLVWEEKLSKYEKEEAEVRARLKHDSEADNANKDHAQQIVRDWQLALFGCEDAMPQRDFHGDINSFVTTR